ncbi:MAG: aminotransferase class I/II-fold pyridoxal phosphate-dependent enzyme [Fusobacterium sp.]|uniref:pyridoxal phosphate-dependent aminotransferase n=1 Tax=Fusobacterium sp. TaxID=68766 RepID=UPI0026DCB16D|nr:aminotransferase class I/II-fold pyridoxal phosphate-dependent enzyme [Fusobacterium sp.]MDO4690824.1 aminotransferase class I/II-fold pyridoxal phosphate-dependent enzyme [Fusobacterium sp.]
MLAKKYTGKKLVDNIFTVSRKAKEAITKYGKENVINATIGSLYNEDEKLAVYSVVEEVYRTLPPEDLYAYSTNVIGEDEYLSEVEKTLLGFDFKETMEGLYVASIATPGGTGAISNTIKNYLNPGEKVLLPNWMWGTYRNIVLENDGLPETYELFNSKGGFNLEDFKKCVSEISKEQENLIVIINEPSHNPTGFRMTYEEWEEVYKFIKTIKHTNLILIRDVAYFEYDDRTEDEKNKIRKLLLDLPANILVMYAFSLSKSLSIYGMRVGAQIAVSSSKEVIQEFKDALSFSCRVTWSNVSKGGMKLFAKIMKDPILKERFLKEKNDYMKLLMDRANLFLNESKHVGLDYLPYKSGFFITLPVGDKVDKVIEDLEAKNIFVIKFNDGIRIGICSVPLLKIVGLAKKIKDSIEKFN